MLLLFDCVDSYYLNATEELLNKRERMTKSLAYHLSPQEFAILSSFSYNILHNPVFPGILTSISVFSEQTLSLFR